jgi:ankyrin repeat protein
MATPPADSPPARPVGRLLAVPVEIFPTIPNELLFMVCNWMEPADISALSCTSSRFHIALTPLVNHNILTYRSPTRDTMLHIAVGRGNLPQSKLALSIGVPVNTAELFGWTALHSAVASDHPKIVELLLSHGANVAADNGRGQTALHLAASFAHAPSETLSLLLFHGADIQAVTAFGLTALHFAAMHGSAASVKVLLEAGAEVNAKDAAGRTALHHASRNRVEHVTLLLDAGADVNALDEFAFKTALDFALDFAQMEDSWRYIEIIQKLVEAGGKTAAELH